MKKASIFLISLLFIATAFSTTKTRTPSLKQRLETLEKQVENLVKRVQRLETQLEPASSEPKQDKDEARDKRVETKNRKTEKSETVDSDPLEFDVISTKSYENEMLGVQVKITNLSSHHINSCEVTCILKNGEGKDLAFERHYVIKSTEGGLSPGNSTYFEYVINVQPELVKNVSFHIDSIY
ncbi:MAG: hypothetical protein WC476_07580 [Phycisphaerae bacterium]|jgi:hypothetical protein